MGERTAEETNAVCQDSASKGKMLSHALYVISITCFVQCTQGRTEGGGLWGL